jgi:Fe-S cluster biogenesis protein NfuA
LSEEREFQERVKKIGSLVQELDNVADPAARTAAKALLQSLMDLHGTGLERVLEIVFQSGNAGSRVIDELGRDPLVGSLLILYGLHPEDLQTRVERKLEQIRSKLFKMGTEAELVSVNGGEVRLRMKADGHACGSTARSIRAMVEEEIYDAAPDLTSLAIEGLEEKSASGFIEVEKLLGTSRGSLPQSPIGSAAPPSRSASLAVHSEGMD